MKVAETFVSINGEGVHAGKPAVFVRFAGCNLNCSYCDTRWANEPDCPFEERTPARIAEDIRRTGITDVTLTGGEPLLQPQMPELFGLLVPEKDLRVEVETNGSVDLAPFCGRYRPVFTMDYKLPSSLYEDRMCLSNFALLAKEDAVKFVAQDQRDLQRALEIIRQYRLEGRCSLFISPVFGKLDPTDIAAFLIENRLNGVRLQIQLHKVIWDPEARGV